MKIGDVIRQRREELGMTMDDLALDLGVATQTVRDNERHKTTPRWKMVVALAAEFGIGMIVEALEEELKEA